MQDCWLLGENRVSIAELLYVFALFFLFLLYNLTPIDEPRDGRNWCGCMSQVHLHYA